VALLAQGRQVAANTRVCLRSPIAALLFCYAILRSMALALRHGGIRWRETFYPLEELRKQTGLE
jgi:hypothetical protein